MMQGLQVLLGLHQPMFQRPEHPDGRPPRQETALAVLGRGRQPGGVSNDRGHDVRDLRPPAVSRVVVGPGRPPLRGPALARVPHQHRLRSEHWEAIERNERAPKLPLARRGQGSLDVPDALDLQVVSKVRVAEDVHVGPEPLHARPQVVGAHCLGQAGRYEVSLLWVCLQARDEVGEGKHGVLLGSELQKLLHIEDLVVDGVHQLGGGAVLDAHRPGPRCQPVVRDGLVQGAGGLPLVEVRLRVPLRVVPRLQGHDEEAARGCSDLARQHLDA
mmetsp:Transcript_46147/g.137941  ORF Transcript_46147/g.137941 Transcript_46147/m.137941 type:complete len:273 (+) Transcript_46147:505-1323(+)